MKKIAIIGPIHEIGTNFLTRQRCELIEIHDFSKKNLIKNLQDVEGIILRTAKIDNDIINKCSKLKIIARHGVGYDNLDINYLIEKNIALAITGTSNAASVAEHVFSMFLYLTKKTDKFDALVKAGNFEKKNDLPDCFEIYNKNILILGFGRIGQAVAQRCLGFDSKVYVYDPFIKKQIISSKYCQKINLSEGLKLADFITIHMPLNEKTKNLIKKDQFLLMKKNSIIVNTARGGIINEADLLWALQNKEIHSAGLDVFEQEPPKKNNPLLKNNNIVLTPHNAALTLECRKRMSLESAENIVYYLNNKKHLNTNNIVNKASLNL